MKTGSTPTPSRAGSARPQTAAAAKSQDFSQNTATCGGEDLSPWNEPALEARVDLSQQKQQRDKRDAAEQPADTLEGRPADISDSWTLRWAVIIGSCILVVLGGVMFIGWARSVDIPGPAEMSDNVFPVMNAFPHNPDAEQSARQSTQRGNAGTGSASGTSSSSGGSYNRNASPVQQQSEQMQDRQELMEQQQDMREQRASAPYEEESARLKAEQDMLEQQEQLEEQQREAVPSLLPENPPKPVTDFGR